MNYNEVLANARENIGKLCKAGKHPIIYRHLV